MAFISMETAEPSRQHHPRLQLMVEMGQRNCAAPASSIAMSVREMVVTMWTSALKESEQDESCPTPLLLEETCHLSSCFPSESLC